MSLFIKIECSIFSIESGYSAHSGVQFVGKIQQKRVREQQTKSSKYDAYERFTEKTHCH